MSSHRPLSHAPQRTVRIQQFTHNVSLVGRFLIISFAVIVTFNMLYLLLTPHDVTFYTITTIFSSLYFFLQATVRVPHSLLRAHRVLRPWTRPSTHAVLTPRSCARRAHALAARPRPTPRAPPDASPIPQ